MTDQYYVIGSPVSHSLSQRIHQAFAKQAGQHMAYEAKEVKLEDLNPFIEHCVESGVRGCNVTLPLKLAAHTLCDTVDHYAQQSGAVSYVTFKGEQLHGGNLDGLGLVWDLQHQGQFSIKGKQVLVLGTGGAVQNILPALLEQNPMSLTVAYRTAQPALQLQAKYSTLRVVPYGELNQAYDLVINGTSASLTGEIPPLPNITIDSNTLCYDMMYDLAADTAFLSWCRQQGANCCIDGLGMLIEQNAEIFYQWRGIRVETQPLYQLFGRT